MFGSIITITEILCPFFMKTGEKKTLDFNFLLHIFEDDKLSKHWYQHLLRVHTE